jgi:hypothetical protein
MGSSPQCHEHSCTATYYVLHTISVYNLFFFLIFFLRRTYVVCGERPSGILCLLHSTACSAIHTLCSTHFERGGVGSTQLQTYTLQMDFSSRRYALINSLHQLLLLLFCLNCRLITVCQFYNPVDETSPLQFVNQLFVCHRGSHSPCPWFGHFIGVC